MTVVAGCTVETVSESSIVIQTGVGSGWTWSWDIRSGWTVGASWTHVLILGGACVVTVPTSTTVSCVKRIIKAILTYLSDILVNFQVLTNISVCLNDILHMVQPDLRDFHLEYLKYKHCLNLHLLVKAALESHSTFLGYRLKAVTSPLGSSIPWDRYHHWSSGKLGKHIPTEGHRCHWNIGH